jgi:hypothetical protein
MLDRNDNRVNMDPPDQPDPIDPVGESPQELHVKGILYQLRDDIADASWQLFMPEDQGLIKDQHLERVEKAMFFVCYAISEYLEDFDGYEEEAELIGQYHQVFDGLLGLSTTPARSEEPTHDEYHNLGDAAELPF